MTWHCAFKVTILASRKFRVNPDNVATPIAAALGDLVTLGLLSLVATTLATAGLAIAILLLLYAIIAFYSYRLDRYSDVLV